MNQITWRSALALVLGISAMPASACSYPPPPSFSELLLSAKSVYVFRVDSLAMTTDSISSSGQLTGRIRVTQVLKGGKPKQEYLSFYIGWCGGLHLDVGSYYVVATSENGRTLALGPGDRSVLALGGRIQPPAKSRDQFGVLKKVELALRTGKIPQGFPSADDVARTDPAMYEAQTERRK